MVKTKPIVIRYPKIIPKIEFSVIKASTDIKNITTTKPGGVAHKAMAAPKKQANVINRSFINTPLFICKR
jgi:hypothetical protein